MGLLKKHERSVLVYHTPVWVAAPLRVDRAGNTKPGFLCIHDLENGKGLCGSTSFEEVTGQHCCSVMLRGRWKISRPCYDKHRRCPGWAGGGWKSAKNYLCHDRDGYSGYLDIDFQSRWWSLKTSRCSNCDVIVLPVVVKWTSLRTWWYGIRFARSSWRWLFRLETWWGKKRGWW